MKHILRRAALALAAVLLTSCTAPAAPVSPVVAEAVYPEMAPYPDESQFYDAATGEFDNDGFAQAYELWSDSHYSRSRVPQGYADSLTPYFKSSIPAFLAGDMGENAVCSPVNVYLALAMLAETADGDSRQQILDLMGANSMEALRSQAGQVWNAHYCNDGAATCILANSLWLDSGLTYNPDTVQTLTDSYYASTFQGELGSPQMNAALQSWLNEQTGGLLQEQAKQVEMDPNTVLALASTLYYRAKWKDEFQPENNTQDIFHAPSGDQDVTFMNRTDGHGVYYWGEDFGAVQLTLGDGDRMWLILPDEGKTPQDLLESGHAMELILGGASVTENQKMLRINLRLPKFDVVDDTRLNDALQNLGITDVFDPEKADFTSILPQQAAWVDAVSHAARVKVDEEGVEAAAYTAIMMAGAARPPEEEMDFVLDRPFLFVISSYRSNLPLFAGVVNEP